MLALNTVLSIVILVILLIGVVVFSAPKIVQQFSSFSWENLVNTFLRKEEATPAEMLEEAIKCVYYSCIEGCESENVADENYKYIKCRSDYCRDEWVDTSNYYIEKGDTTKRICVNSMKHPIPVIVTDNQAIFKKDFEKICCIETSYVNENCGSNYPAARKIKEGKKCYEFSSNYCYSGCSPGKEATVTGFIYDYPMIHIPPEITEGGDKEFCEGMSSTYSTLKIYPGVYYVWGRADAYGHIDMVICPSKPAEYRCCTVGVEKYCFTEASCKYWGGTLGGLCSDKSEC